MLMITPTPSVAQRLDRDEASCLEAPPYDKNREIELRQGMDLQKFHASMNLPTGYKFIRTEDARYYLRHWPKLTPCQLQNLVGMIVPKNMWGDPATTNAADNWQVEVYYDPGFVSTEDAISARYDEMVQQVRESYYEKQRGYTQYDLRDYKNVIGWATPPGYIREIDTMIWSLHVSTGNNFDYYVPINAVKMGRFGRFRFYIDSSYQKHQPSRMTLIKAAASFAFDKGFAAGDSNLAKDPAPQTTIGQLVAKSVEADLLPPVTWPEYLNALARWFSALLFRYALDILALVTIVTLAAAILFLRSKFNRLAGAYPTEIDVRQRDESRDPPSVPRLNGQPLHRS